MRYSERILKLALEESIYNMIMESSVSNKCIDDFGKILFGDFQKKNEKDTKIEKNYFELIRSFIENSDKHPALKDALLSLKKCTSQYPDILKPEKNIIYRGAPIKDDLYKKFEPIEDDKEALQKLTIKKFGTRNYVLLDKSYNYNPGNDVQSWTINPSSANNFADNYDYSVIYELFAKPSEIIFSTKFLNKLANSVGHGDEHEVIRIGKNVRVKAWVRIDIKL